MNILKWEIRKILQRRATQICILLAFAYAIFTTSMNGIHNLGSRNHNGWNNNDGVEEIKRNYDFADAWKGKLDEKKLLKMFEQYKMAYQAENMETFEDGSKGPSNEVYEKYVTPLGDFPYFIWHTFSWYPEYESIYQMENIPNNLAADYYNQRDIIVTEYLQSQRLNEEDLDYFTKQETQVEKPFYYDWYEGQRMFIDLLSPIPNILAVLFCIIVAPVFAYECQHKTDSILLTTKKGRHTLAFAKLAAVLIVTIPAYLLCILTYVIGQLAFVGTRALDCPIQFIEPFATAPYTLGELELYIILLGLLSTIAMVLITALLSSCMKSVSPVIILSLAVIFVPRLFKSVIPKSLDIITTIIPFMKSYEEVLRTNRYHIFGNGIWSPYLILITMVIISVLCIPMTLLKYKKHEVTV